MTTPLLPATGERRARTRLLIEAPLAAGGQVALGVESGHYLRVVLRLKPGDGVLAFNATDGEYEATIVTLDKKVAALTIGQRLRSGLADAADMRGPWLAFAPLKGGRTDALIEKATELGVSRLMPVLMRRSDVDKINRERLEAQVREAAQQCERLDVPVIEPLQPLARLLAGWDAGRRLFVAAERGAALAMVMAVTDNPSMAAAFLIGPEGGFDPAELDLLAALPFVVMVGLGPRILRADTAAMACLAVWQANVGDWTRQASDARPPYRG
jgi:16S rRNA (uracil1498-N3)-methyltransferase